MMAAMDLSRQRPVTCDEFASAINGLRPWVAPRRVALAVSGGPDSMALALLARSWAARDAKELVALIVDHGLRDDSAAEADRTLVWLRRLGLDGEVLRWEHGAVTRAVHRTARKARYDLLSEACRRRGVSCLMLAHHRDDQAETVLMRFAKGSGIDGLAGMRSLNRRDGIELVRPLLHFPKARLVATCRAQGQDFVTDPSNENDCYARGRLRGIKDLLAAEGLDEDRLVDLAARAEEAREALSYYAYRTLSDAVVFDPYGAAVVNLSVFASVPTDIQMRVLALVLRHVGGGGAGDYGPKRQALKDLLRSINTGKAGRTLEGCQVVAQDGICVVIREYAAVTDSQPLVYGVPVVWDGRFHVELLREDAPSGLRVAALGVQPHDCLDRIAPWLRRCVPRGRVRASLPTLWQGDDIWAVPDIFPVREKNPVAVAYGLGTPSP